ncbi:phage/plasmid primase, P4 family [Treponema primitia]|uniref:DNA primase family protein n=1 Tax=Treponema primitia TaxID=88058 RepID=UPI0039817465
MKKIEKLSNPITSLAIKNNPGAFMQQDGTLSLELFTQKGMSQWVASGLGGRLLYANALGWMVYNDETGAFTAEYGAAVLQNILMFYTDLLFENVRLVSPRSQESAFKFYRTYQSRACIEAVGALMQKRGDVFCIPAEFDVDDGVINCNGIVVSTDGTTRTATPDDRFTMSATVRPEDGETPVFDGFLEWATCGNDELKGWLLTACGVALFGHVTDRITNFYGNGSNGKGTLLRTLQKIMRGYATALPRSLVIKEKYSNSRFDKAGLPGKRAAILYDLKPDQGRLNLDELKSIAGDGDEVFVEKKGLDGYSCRLKCKVFIASNDKIPIDSFGKSEKKRFRLVPFNAELEAKDSGLEDRFVPEYGKILNLFIQYAVKYYADWQKMPPCRAIDIATEQYFNDQDLVKQFLEDSEAFAIQEYAIKTDFYTKFEQYCMYQQGIRRPMKIKTFTNELEKRGIYEHFKKIDGKSARVFSRKDTATQKTPEFNLDFTFSGKSGANLNLYNSCAAVSPTTAAESESSLYQDEKKRRLWEAGEIF